MYWSDTDKLMCDDGDKEVIKDSGLYMPGLSFRLISPQALLKTMVEESGQSGEVFYLVGHDRSILKLKSGKQVTVMYDPDTNLPVLNAYSDLEKAERALKGYTEGGVTDEDNQNLTVMQKALLNWHYRLGHLGMQHTQWLGRQGILDSLGKRWGSTTVNIPKCAPCLLGKQKRRTKPGTRVIKTSEGILKKDILEPGDLVFTDQYESRLEGRLFTYKGADLKHEKYNGGTIFCDAASNYIFMEHQTGFTAEETILANLKFEREAMGVGVTVRRYSTDNGVYNSLEFMKEIHKNNQVIRHCGVGAHHGNGVAENAIGNVVRKGGNDPPCSFKVASGD